jgi:PAS domain S-box-containing protein
MSQIIDYRQQIIENRVKELQDSTDFVHNLLKCITGYSIIVGDFDGNIVVFNEGAHHTFGLEPKDVVGLMNIEDFYPLHFVKAGKLTLLFDRLIKENGCFFELERQRSNGETFPGQSLLTLVQDNDGRFVGFVEITEDITERKKVQEQQEIANRRLIELDKLKDEFVSMVSHELRTPLASIMSFVDILISYPEDKTTQQEFLCIIKDESERLTRLVNDFLDISKIQAGRMEWKTVELPIEEVIQSAVIASRSLIDKAKLHLRVEVEPNLPHVLGDKDRLIQVITNLVGNAYKYTPEGGNITLKAWLNQEDASIRDSLAISISDTGRGIPTENLPCIFESFGRVGETIKDRPKGTGLGLSICKKIIENHGGKIWVESTLGQGTTFFFTLPVANEPSTEAMALKPDRA